MMFSKKAEKEIEEMGRSRRDLIARMVPLLHELSEDSLEKLEKLRKELRAALDAARASNNGQKATN